MSFQIINNKEKKQYEYRVENKLAKIEYIIAKDTIYLTHTEVPVELEGKGIGSGLVLVVLEDIKLNGWTLVPLCPFVAAYLKRHQEWRELVLKGINIA